MPNEAADRELRFHDLKHHGRRIPLRYQVLLPMSATMLITLLVISVLTAAFAARRATSRVQADVERIAGTLRATTFPLTDAVLETIAGLSGAELMLTDAANVRAAGTSAVKRSGWGPRAMAADSVNAELSRVTLNEQTFFHRVLELSRPTDGGKPVYLHVLYPESAWVEARREAIYPPLVIGGIGAVITAALSQLLSRRITQPISRIADLMTNLAAGNYQLTAVPKRNDELRDLTLAANNLAAELDGLHRAIRRGERLTLLGRLSSGLAHQMRNSATGARLAMQLHRRSCPDGDRESIDVALRQLELVEEQLVGFLTIGKPQESRRDACELTSIARDVERLVAANCKHRGIELLLELPAEQVIVTGDAAQLRQLLINLTLNAIDAADRGGRVRIVVERRPQRIRVAVYDSGTGIRSDLSESLFEPFVTTKPEGIGLGLAVANRIAIAHDGQLKYSRVECETCFELGLPIPIEKSMTPAQGTPEAAVAGVASDRRKESLHA